MLTSIHHMLIAVFDLKLLPN